MFFGYCIACLHINSVAAMKLLRLISLTFRAHISKTDFFHVSP